MNGTGLVTQIRQNPLDAEANLLSQERIDFLSVELQDLLQKQAISVVPPQDRKSVSSLISW